MGFMRADLPQAVRRTRGFLRPSQISDQLPAGANHDRREVSVRGSDGPVEFVLKATRAAAGLAGDGLQSLLFIQ